ncbi:HIT domain-containing protein [Methylomonas paludis]|uniref:HIT domain-containing protein n=1 Tax=Methylomonas paludis TaxID=1173101 RepID=A0A975MKW4_9GAMM|nr:HIT domain-containing protein [Methylomonas paludis]QWF69682.1 HIT domain-containing protein [Methylomonas paludis]
MQIFELHHRLAADCFEVADLTLSKLLMMNDSRYPWFILVPRRNDIREIYQLAAADRRQLLDESCLLAEALQHSYNPDKLNIAAIGNLVPQLHLHHVVRYQSDATWPAPVWGKLPALTYAVEQAQIELERIRKQLQL